MNNKWKIILGIAVCIFAIFMFATATQEPNTDTGGHDMYRNRRITAAQARDMIARYPSAIILDVRNEWEFAAGHIPGAILLPDYDIKDKVTYILQDLYALILVYCQRGNRSRSATNLLVSMGYVNVYDFGGIVDW